MPNIKKITLDWSETGETVYCIIRREADSYRLNDADGDFAVNPADPYLSLAEDSVIKGRYEVSESRQVWNNGNYTLSIYKQAGGSPAPVSDTIIGTGIMYVVSDTEIVLNADVNAVKTETDSHPTLAEIEASSILAKEGNVEAHVTNSLNSYDPPTRTELTSDKDAIIAEVNANESKIDVIDTILDRVAGLVHENILIDNTTYDSDNNLTTARLRIFPSKADLLAETNVLATYTITATASGEGKFTSWKQVKD